jgi:hypothetical protein
MSTPTHVSPVHTLRQRGSVVLGVIAMTCCAGLLVISLLNPPLHLSFVGVMLLGIAIGWVLFVRPNVALSLAGVHLGNPLRRTTIPWALVEDVSARWNLEVYAGGRAYSVWAISSHIERPRGGGGAFGIGSALGQRLAEDAASGPRPERGVTAFSAAELIEAAREEWQEAAASGEIAGVDRPEVAQAWDVPDVLALLVPAALILAGTAL